MTILQKGSSFILPRKISPKPSATIELAQKARILKSQGRDIIELAGGDPDFAPDSHVRHAITTALNNGETKYTHPRGIPQLRKAIANKLKRENNINANPDSEIIVTVGGKEAIAITLMALLEYGDEVLIPTPSWVSFDNMAIIAGGIPKPVPGKASNFFKITPDDLEKQVTKRSKAIIINNPHNPTGQVYSEKEIRDICDWCINRNILIISDEVYEHIIFENRKLFSPASVDKYRGNVISVNAVSKSYAMTGLRLGWLHAPEELVDKIDPIHQHLITCASSIIQWGAQAALDGSPEKVIERQKIYSYRRDLIVKLLSGSKTVKPIIPDGTFFIFMNIEKTGMKSGEFCEFLLDNGNLALCPGSAFGNAGEGWVRLLFARDEASLTIACERIIKVFS
jgi:aspartate/methionine/tyrosine aminotransferase